MIGALGEFHYNLSMKIKTLTPSLADLQHRYQHLLTQVYDLPHERSRVLTLCNRQCGWVTPAACAALEGLEGVVVTPDAVHVAWGASPSEAVNALLARIALRLDEQGLVKTWRNELLNAIANTEIIGAIERGAVRPLGLLTQAVHLNAWSPDGRLWVARRAANKPTDPNMWDTLVGGLASAFEDLETSLVRESAEEAGLAPQHLQCRDPMRTLLRMYRRLPEGYQVEDVLISDCVLDEGVIPQNQDGEVSEIRLLSLADWWDMVQSDVFTLEAEMVLIDSVRLRLMQA